MVAGSSTKWSEEEKTALRKGRENGLTVPEIAGQIGRPVSAVYAQARKIGATVMVRKVWAEAEDVALRDAVARGATMAEVAESLGRTVESVRWRKASLGLTNAGPKPGRRQGRRRKSTATEGRKVRAGRAGKPRPSRVPNERYKRDRDALRLAWAETTDLSELATRLGKSLTWVRGATLELGLREKRQRKSFDDDAARDEIRALAQSCTITEAAKKLSRDPRTVRRIAEEIGVTFPVATRAKTGTERKASGRKPAPPRQKPARPLPPQAMAKRLQLIRKVAQRMRQEGRLPPLH